MKNIMLVIESMRLFGAAPLVRGAFLLGIECIT